MKFFIISDLHGSAPAFARAAEAFEREKADYLVLCGDYLNHGPRNPIPDGYDPQSLAEHINRYADRVLGVRGNCDSEIDQMLLSFPCLGDYLVFFTAGRRCLVTHGHIHTEKDHPPLSAGDVFISGHTHVPVLKEENGIFVVNPGSLPLPKSELGGGYALITDSGITIKSLDGTDILPPLSFS
jgi:hypothetical protein